jgi:hypothetical protein
LKRTMNKLGTRTVGENIAITLMQVLVMVYKRPKDIFELEKLYFGKNKDGKDIDTEAIKRYEKDLRNPAKCQDELNESESIIKNFLLRFGEVKKIPEEENKTPDFEIVGKNTFVEVKSINTVIEERISETKYKANIKNESEWIKKIDLTLKDIEQKRDKIPQDSLYVGAICVIDVEQTLGFGKNITHLDFIMKTILEQVDVDGLLVFLGQVSGNVKPQIPTLFSKNPELTLLFKGHYSNKELEIKELKR